MGVQANVRFRISLSQVFSLLVIGLIPVIALAVQAETLSQEERMITCVDPLNQMLQMRLHLKNGVLVQAAFDDHEEMLFGILSDTRWIEDQGAEQIYNPQNEPNTRIAINMTPQANTLTLRVFYTNHPDLKENFICQL